MPASSQPGNFGIWGWANAGSPLDSVLCLAGLARKLSSFTGRHFVRLVGREMASHTKLTTLMLDGWEEDTAVIVWRWRDAPHSALRLVGEKGSMVPACNLLHGISRGSR